MKLWGVFAAFLVALGAACGGGSGTSATQPVGSVVPTNAPAYWAPIASDVLQWQLSTLPVDTAIAATAYDVDAFDTPAGTVSTLHAAGRHAVCYVDAGTLETWRSDAAAFQAHPEIIGKADVGWPNEFWLDIRRLDILGPVLQARIDMCKSKGFDAMEADNVDGYVNATGFSLTAADQLAFNTWIATQAHARGMSVALKNDPDQIPSLVASFDWAIEEDCFAQSWCSLAKPFTAAGKAVEDIEYTDVTPAYTFTTADCPQAALLGQHVILKHRTLDAWLAICQ